MFSRPILIYSNYCKYSNEFANKLMEIPLSQHFVYINVDVDPVTKKRSDDFLNLKMLLAQQFNYNLNSVPTIITENGEFILKDADAFDWLGHTIDTMRNTQMNKNISETNTDTPQQSQQSGQPGQQQEEPQEITGFNPNEMGSFSDMYSTFGLDITDPCMDAKNQCFQFLGNDFKITTPQAEATTAQPQGQQPIKTVRFSAGDSANGKIKNKRGFGTEKEKELNSKYEQMMLERQMMDKKMVPERV